MPRRLAMKFQLCWLLVSVFVGASRAAETRWYKGNLHTHTLWSDGDDYPENIVSWYKDQGYNFLALSDHNVLLEGTKWVTITNTPKREMAFRRYVEAFGSNWVFLRTVEGKRQVRLKTLTEFRPLFEESGRFLLIPSEELSDKYQSIPIHLNVSNVRDRIPVGRGLRPHVEGVVAGREVARVARERDIDGVRA